MKRRALTIILAVSVALGAVSYAGAGTSDYELAKEWKNANAKGGHIETLNTKAQGGRTGKVVKNGKVTKWKVRYPKKVKKGKKVKVYLVYKKGESECSAMVCCGKVK